MLVPSKLAGSSSGLGWPCSVIGFGGHEAMPGSTPSPMSLALPAGATSRTARWLLPAAGPACHAGHEPSSMSGSIMCC